jgi:hypothetical protein
MMALSCIPWRVPSVAIAVSESRDDQRAPALARGERGDQPALRRFIVDQHQQALLDFRHYQSLGPQFSRPGDSDGR